MIGRFKAKTTYKDKAEFNNLWVYGNLINSANSYFIHPENNRVRVNGEIGKIIIMHEVVPETICRPVDIDFVSLRQFWENDIISYGEAVGIIRYGIFNSKYVGFYIEWQGKFHDWRNDLVFWLPKVKRIGNIFDNPEFLQHVAYYERYLKTEGGS